HPFPKWSGSLLVGAFGLSNVDNPPLSEVNTTIVSSLMPVCSSVFIIRPTFSSTLYINPAYTGLLCTSLVLMPDIQRARPLEEPSSLNCFNVSKPKLRAFSLNFSTYLSLDWRGV